MSKLSDRIRRAGRAESAPFGFAAHARPQPSPTLITVVRLGNEPGKSADAAKAGADAVIAAGDAGKLKDISDDAILGVAADKISRKSAAALREAGADFVLLTRADLAETMLEEKLGFVLELRSELDDVRLRLLGDMGLDAIILPAPEKPLTVERLVDLRRVAALARTPLLVEDDGSAEAAALQLFRDSGVAGIALPASAIGKLAALRERIAALPARGKRRQEHEDALVPAQATAGHDHDDDFDDDDD